MFKNIYVCLGISIGVLAGLFVAVIYVLSETPAIDGIFDGTITTIVPPMVVAWALYFAHGKGGVSFWKVGATTTIGAIMASVIMIIASCLFVDALGQPIWLGLGVGVLICAFIMAFEATWSPLDFVPGAFCGTATAFGIGALYFFVDGSSVLPVVQIILAFWIGLIGAWLSDKWGNAMLKKEK